MLFFFFLSSISFFVCVCVVFIVAVLSGWRVLGGEKERFSGESNVFAFFRFCVFFLGERAMSNLLTPTILLLREGTDTSQGVPQIISNINACAAVVDVRRTKKLVFLLVCFGKAPSRRERRPRSLAPSFFFFLRGFGSHSPYRRSRRRWGRAAWTNSSTRTKVTAACCGSVAGC